MLSAMQNDDVQLEANIRWADAFVLIYSVSDRKSYDYAERHLALVQRLRAVAEPPPAAILSSSSSISGRRRDLQPTTKDDVAVTSFPVAIAIAANKIDCPPDARHVTVDDGLRLATGCRNQLQQSVVVRELSVAESPLGVAAVVEDVVQQVGTIHWEQLWNYTVYNYKHCCLSMFNI